MGDDYAVMPKKKRSGRSLYAVGKRMRTSAVDGFRAAARENSLRDARGGAGSSSLGEFAGTVSWRVSVVKERGIFLPTRYGTVVNLLSHDLLQPEAFPLFGDMMAGSLDGCPRG